MTEISTREGGAEARTHAANGAPIAPWWHCGLLIAIIASGSALGAMHTAKSTMALHHPRRCGVALALEWGLAGFAYWGLRLRRTPLQLVTGERRRGLNALLLDAAAAGSFWIGSLILMASIAVVLRRFHLEGVPKQISQLAPASAAEAGLWIALSVSAGICEEFVFRGYLQQQFARGTGRVWVGVAVSALLFGTAHGYEGAAGMVVLTVLGALLSMLAIKRGSLRAGMIAHGWHDGFTGILLWALRRANVPLGVA